MGGSVAAMPAGYVGGMSWRDFRRLMRRGKDPADGVAISLQVEMIIF